ncbi:Eukaryotic translation initiation factor 2-alpha kinase 4, partial [Tetrabaena socialis]
MGEFLPLELEALHATYTESDLTIDESAGDAQLVMVLRLSPRGVDAHDAFIAGALRLRVGALYPDEAPEIELLDTKGMGDQRCAQLRAHLCDQAASLVGEMALGALCEHALDWVTEHNQPE